MSTAHALPNTVEQNLLEQRLDVIDRALLGVLPRSERIAMVAEVETRIRDLATESPTNTVNRQEEIEFLNSAPSGSSLRGTTRSSVKTRSRLAFSAGVLGIVGLVLLFGTPVVYLVVAVVASMLDEFVAISLLGTHVVAIALGGLAAVTLGIAALVSLNRHKGRLVGYGWAVTGLCTGALPLLVGAVMILVAGSQMQVANVYATTTAVPESSSLPAPLQAVPAADEAADIHYPTPEMKTAGFVPKSANSHAEEFASEPRVANELPTEFGSRSVPPPQANSESAPLSDSAPADSRAPLPPTPVDPEVAPQAKPSDPPATTSP